MQNKINMRDKINAPGGLLQLPAGKITPSELLGVETQWQRPQEKIGHGNRKDPYDDPTLGDLSQYKVDLTEIIYGEGLAPHPDRAPVKVVDTIY